METATDRRLRQIEELREQASDSAVGSLTSILQTDPDMAVRGEAARALGGIGGDDAAFALIVGLTNESRHARLSAAEALGRMEERRAVRGLVELLKDRDRTVRLKAIEALGRIGDPAAVDALVEALADPNPSVKMLAAESLGRIGDARAVGALVGSLVDGNTMVRRPTLDAIAAIGGDEAVRPLMGSLEDKAWEIQLHAARALANIGGSQSAGALMGWSQRVFSSEMRKMSAEEKIALVREVLDGFFRQLDTANLEELAPKLQTAVRVKSWENLDSDSEAAGWKTSAVEHPIWGMIKEELERRGIGTKTVAPSAPPASAGPSVANGRPVPEPVRDEDDPDAPLPLVGESLQGAAGGSRVSPTEPEPARPGPGDFGPGSSEPADSAPPADAGSAPASPAAPAAETAAEAEAEEEDVPLSVLDPASEFPEPPASVREFLQLLREKDLVEVVLVGGAVRDCALGVEPEDLDVSVLAEVWEEVEIQPSDPVSWNLQHGGGADETLRKLAEALGCEVSALLDGTAEFRHSRGTIPVHYVGPYVIEETEIEFRDFHAEQRIRRVASRLGLVVDRISGDVRGLTATTRVDRMWMDCGGRPSAAALVGLRDLEERRLEAEAPMGRLTPMDLLRLLYLQFRIGGVPSEATAELMLRSADEAAASPESSRKAFSSRAIERLLAVAGVERAADALDALGLAPMLADSLDPETRERLESALGRSRGDREALLGSAREETGNARQALDARRAAFDETRAEFNRQADALDASKGTSIDLDGRLRAQIDRLAAADKLAREANERLETATRNFGGLARGGAMDTGVLKEHRDALADKRAKDAEVAGIKREVESLRQMIERKQAGDTELQERLEKLGEDLEAAHVAFVEAEAALAAAEGRLAGLESANGATPERRLERLRSLAT